MHLETRLVQLDSAISMELWQVGFVLCPEWAFFVLCWLNIQLITHRHSQMFGAVLTVFFPPFTLGSL